MCVRQAVYIYNNVVVLIVNGTHTGIHSYVTQYLDTLSYILTTSLAIFSTDIDSFNFPGSLKSFGMVTLYRYINNASITANMNPLFPTNDMMELMVVSRYFLYL